MLDEPRFLDAPRSQPGGCSPTYTSTSTGALRRVSRDGVAGSPDGVLEDYACVADGFLALFAATGEPRWVDVAAAARRPDPDALPRRRAAASSTRPSDAETLLKRPQDPADNASPSGQGMTLDRARRRCAGLTGDERYAEAAADARCHGLSGLAERAPRFAGQTLSAVEALADGPRQVAVVGPPTATPPRALVEAAHRAQPHPGLVIAVGDGTGGDGAPCSSTGRLVEGRPAAYACHDFVCDLPVTDPAAPALTPPTRMAELHDDRLAALRTEDLHLITGNTLWTANVRPQGTLHLVFVRSPMPHARFTVDVAVARNAPGRGRGRGPGADIARWCPAAAQPRRRPRHAARRHRHGAVCRRGGGRRRGAHTRGGGRRCRARRRRLRPAACAARRRGCAGRRRAAAARGLATTTSSTTSCATAVTSTLPSRTRPSSYADGSSSRACFRPRWSRGPPWSQPDRDGFTVWVSTQTPHIVRYLLAQGSRHRARTGCASSLPTSAAASAASSSTPRSSSRCSPPASSSGRSRGRRPGARTSRRRSTAARSSRTSRSPPPRAATSPRSTCT